MAIAVTKERTRASLKRRDQGFDLAEKEALAAQQRPALSSVGRASAYSPLHSDAYDPAADFARSVLRKTDWIRRLFHASRPVNHP